MDTRLGYISLPLEADGAELTQGRVPAFGLAETVDEIEHLGLCLISLAIGFARDPLGLERREPKAGAANQLSMTALPAAVRIWNCRSLPAT
jgi:hypothetical protein